MLSRFHLIPERYGQTDRRTDRIAISISRVSVLTRDKNELKINGIVYTVIYLTLDVNAPCDEHIGLSNSSTIFCLQSMTVLPPMRFLPF